MTNRNYSCKAPPRGGVVWISGLSSSGKTTLAREAARRLAEQDVAHEVIDGDEVRAFFEQDLGYSRADRYLATKRLAFAAHLLSRHGVLVLVANIAAYEDLRQWIRRRLERFLLVYMNVSLATCRARDRKGTYDSNRGPVVGVDEPYEPPRNAELEIDSSAESPAAAAERLLALLRERGWI